MSQEENPTEVPQVEAESTPAATGDEAVSDANSLTLEEINNLTGKQYKDKETALKSIKDMSSQAGKAADLEGKLKEALESGTETPDDVVKKLRDELRATQEDVFFANNPEHKENRKILEGIAKAEGVSLADALNSDVYKEVFEAKKIAKESQSKRTIASSKNRQAPAKQEDVNDVLGDPDKSAEFVVNNFFND